MEMSKTYSNFIDGKWKSSKSGKTTASINPANTKEVVGYVQHSIKEVLDEGIEAAKQAKKSWRKLSGAARGEFLFAAANAMERRLNEIAETMTREMGKTLPVAKGETAQGIAILRYYAGEGMRKVGDVIPATDSSALMYTTRAPLGVVGVITPWNFPVAIPIWKMAPALWFSSGCNQYGHGFRNRYWTRCD
jgi:acyl-CoA reductase-like NAD-dependent aldehyde dehydrogenase